VGLALSLKIFVRNIKLFYYFFWSPMLLEILQTKLFLGWGWIAISSRMDVENLEEFGVYGRLR